MKYKCKNNLGTQEYGILLTAITKWLFFFAYQMWKNVVVTLKMRDDVA